MRIRTNIPALNAQFKLRENRSNLVKNLEKLSSGYMINRAGDDAAGLAISEKMRALITGLNRAVLNTEDGISLIRTGEGALQEVHAMLNRLSELAVQSANGIYNDEINRVNLQREADEICDEIDHIARTTNFNNINLFQDEGYHAERTVSSQANPLTLEEVLSDTSDTLKNIIYTETTFDFETTQTPQGTSNNFNANYRSIANTLQTSIVPQVVQAVMGKYTAFNYLTGSSIGIGLELYSDASSSTLAAVALRTGYSTSGGTNTGVSLTYSLRVNVAAIGNLSNPVDRSSLEQTIAHEMIHAFMDEATTVGMTGIAPSGSTNAGFPSWFVEGMAQTASGPGNWTRGSSLGLTEVSTTSQITNALNSSQAKLGSGGTASEYGTGYLACMYLGYLASGKTANMDDPSAAANAITRGVSSILSKLIEGKSLTKVIDETTGGKYTSIRSFENGFAGDSDALAFIQKLLKYTSNALDTGNKLVGGGLLSGSLSNGDPVADTPLSGLKLFALNTGHTQVENKYPSDITILSGGGAMVDGVKPTTSVPPVTPITYPSGVFTVSGGTEGTDWRFDTATGALHILTGKDLRISGGTLSNASGTYYGNIVIDDGVDANITLAGVSIDASKKTGNVAGILLGNGCDVKIAVNGTNTVAGGGEAAGIQLAGNQDSSVTLDLAAGSILTARGGEKGTGFSCGGAGIGAANETDTSKGHITINGQGTLNAYGGEGAAGIGGSYWGSIGDIKISGMGLNVTAVGGEHGAGIGGGWANGAGNGNKSAVKSITIDGDANIKASSKYHGTGIGGGCQGVMGTITIGDPNSDNRSLHIQATGGNDSAGIGGGAAGKVDSITIHGGNITASSGTSGAGIGSGRAWSEVQPSTCGDIVIHGGTIVAKGSTNSSGIGGGMDSTVSSIHINGGTITADGGWTYDGGNIGGYTDKSGKNKTTVTIAAPSGLTIKAGEKGEGKYITTGAVDSNGNTLYALDMKYINQLIQKGSLVPTNPGTDPKLDFPLDEVKVTLKDGTTYSWNTLKHMSENSAYIWAKGEDMTLTFKDADGTEGTIDLKFYDDYGLWRFSEDDLPDELPKEPGYVGRDPSNPLRPLPGGSLVLQVGPYSDSTFEVPRFYFSKTALRLNEYDISTQDNARNSIEKAEWMINRVSQIRGKYGAIDNALGHIINNLNTGIENISQAESRIRDADMAKEMMKYTKNNILIQSAQTMLAQANVLPQAVLQLLQ